MNNLLMTTMALSVLLAFGANQPVEAKSSFSFYLGGAPTYVAPTYVEPYYEEYYVEPQYYVPAPRYVAPRYVAPPPRYYRYYYY